MGKFLFFFYISFFSISLELLTYMFWELNSGLWQSSKDSQPLNLSQLSSPENVLFYEERGESCYLLVEQLPNLRDSGVGWGTVSPWRNGRTPRLEKEGYNVNTKGNKVVGA